MKDKDFVIFAYIIIIFALLLLLSTELPILTYNPITILR
jgi:hypothetical protein